MMLRKKNIIFLLLIFTLMLIIGSCCGSTSPTQKGNVVFTVKDIKSNVSVPFVSVALGKTHEKWGATGGNGITIISQIPVGHYTAVFYASGYETYFENIEIIEGDNAVDVYMTPLEGNDNTKPHVVYFDVDGADLWILFSERMARKSVANSISVQWETFDPCFKVKITDTENYSLEWIQDNILHIDHSEAIEKTCYNNLTGNYEEKKNSWNLKKVKIDDTATDYNGNKLSAPFEF